MLYQQATNVRASRKLLYLKFLSDEWKKCDNKNAAALLRSIISLFVIIPLEMYKDVGMSKNTKDLLFSRKILFKALEATQKMNF